MKTCAALLLVTLAAAAYAQPAIPPQSFLDTWVAPSGDRGFQLRVVFQPRFADDAETVARGAVPRLLADERWCLAGWSIDKAEVTEIAKPKLTLVTLRGTCK